MHRSIFQRPRAALQRSMIRRFRPGEFKKSVLGEHPGKVLTKCHSHAKTGVLSPVKTATFHDRGATDCARRLFQRYRPIAAMVRSHQDRIEVLGNGPCGWSGLQICPSRIGATSLPCRTPIVGRALMQGRGLADPARQHLRMLWSVLSHAIEMVTE